MPSLTPDMLAFIESGVSHQVGAITAAGDPCLCRALGAQQEADGRLVVLISAESGYEVLDAIRANGKLSLVMVEPSSARALHLKGIDGQVESGDPHYRPLVEQRRSAFQRQLQRHGIPADVARAWYNLDGVELMAIRFTPIGAWNQTPGPGAGAAVQLAR